MLLTLCKQWSSRSLHNWPSEAAAAVLAALVLANDPLTDAVAVVCVLALLLFAVTGSDVTADCDDFFVGETSFGGDATVICAEHEIRQR